MREDTSKYGMRSDIILSYDNFHPLSTLSRLNNIEAVAPVILCAASLLYGGKTGVLFDRKWFEEFNLRG